MENSIVGMNFIPNDKLIVLYGHTKLRMSVDNFSKEENHRRVEFPANLFYMFQQRGNVYQNRLVKCTLSKP
jgi:hypothetical protein